MVRIKRKFASFVSCCSRHNETIASINNVRTITDVVVDHTSDEKPTKNTIQEAVDDLSNAAQRGSSPIMDLDDDDIDDASEVSWFPHLSMDSERTSLTQRRFRGGRGGVKSRIGFTTSSNSSQTSTSTSNILSDALVMNSYVRRGSASTRNVKDDSRRLSNVGVSEATMDSNWCTSTPAANHRSIGLPREGHYKGCDISVLVDCGSWTTDCDSDDTLSSSNISEASNITYLNSSLDLTILGNADITIPKSNRSPQSINTKTDIARGQFRDLNIIESQFRTENARESQFRDNNASYSQFRNGYTSEIQFRDNNTSISQFRNDNMSENQLQFDITNNSQFTDNPSSISIYTESIGFDMTRHSPQHLGVSFRDQRTPNGTDEARGVYVSSIHKGSLAHLDGRLSVGDIILEINGIDVESMSNSDALSTIYEQISRRCILTILIGRYYVDSQSVLEAAVLDSVILTESHNKGLQLQPHRINPSEIFVGVELIDWIQGQVTTLQDRSDAIAYVQNLHACGHIYAIDSNGYAIESSVFSQLGWFTFANGFMKSDVGAAVANWSTCGVNACNELRLLAFC